MSISRISLKNFVIVPQLDLELPSGFSALTGETGAGKSILIDALQLALGQRAEASVVYEGAAQAEIAAEFAPNAAAQAWLTEAGFEAEDSLLLRRTVDVKGKSRAWINGSAATLTQLRALAEHLVDIHGQHAWASLSQSGSALALLDAYAAYNSGPLQNAWKDWRSALQRLEDAQAAQASLADERERLEWQLGELGKLQPGADEWDELNQEHSQQSHMQDLLDASARALAALEGGARGDEGACSQLQQAVQSLATVQHLQPQLGQVYALLQDLSAQADDAAHELRSASRHLQPDHARLQALDERVSLWLSLSRRYKSKPEDLPALMAHWQGKLAELEAHSDLPALERAEAQAQAHYLQLAQEASQVRRRHAPQLAQAITAAVQELGMPGGQLQVQVEAGKPQATGQDMVVFLVAGHAGVSPKPLAKIASGGELSRIALAVAVITAEQDGAPTLIFDEVDSGIGGAVAHSVGQLMRRLGGSKQVLAVTHLAQVAACAHQQFLVSKQQSQGHTSSHVALLAAEPRQAEIARMLAGSTSATSLAHAQELLEQAQ